MTKFTSEEIAVATKVVADNALSFTAEQVAGAIQLAEFQVVHEKEFLEGEGYQFATEAIHADDSEIPTDDDDEDDEDDFYDDDCQYSAETYELYQQFVVDFNNGKFPSNAEEADKLAMQVYDATQDGAFCGDTDQTEEFKIELCKALGFVLD